MDCGDFCCLFFVIFSSLCFVKGAGCFLRRRVRFVLYEGKVIVYILLSQSLSCVGQRFVWIKGKFVFCSSWLSICVFIADLSGLLVDFC